MAKVKETMFVCNNCGNEFGRWAGQCPSCGEWNSLKEVKAGLLNLKQGRTSARGGEARSGRTENKIINLGSAKQNSEQNQSRISTKIGEFDRVLGGGIVQGSVVLFSGEPGIGKSTLLTQLLGNTSGLYVAGEESAEQIRLRVNRLGLDAKRLDVLASNSIEEIVDNIERTKELYKIAVVDSIQVVYGDGVSGAAGSISQIRESTFRLVELAKKTGVAIIIVGHVTKEGDIAGPKLLEHMVDTVLYFEGERSGDLRILRVTKNRFGPTDEVGVFRMEGTGLKEMRTDEINLAPAAAEALAGKAVTIVYEGTRPMMLEIQALVTESFAPMPKRVFANVDYNRGQLLVAVAQKVLGIPLYKYDVFVAVTGGIKVEDTGADLAIVAAMWSSFKNAALGSGTVWMGEVSLLGEVRKVRGWEKRVKEANGLGRKVIEIRNIREIKGNSHD